MPLVLSRARLPRLVFPLLGLGDGGEDEADDDDDYDYPMTQPS